MEEKNIQKKYIKAICDKRYREKNKQKIAEKKKQYYLKNKENINGSQRVKDNRKRYYEKHKNEISEKRKQKRLENLEATRQKERDRKARYKKNEKNRRKLLDTTKKYVNNKYKNDPVFKLKCCYRNYIGKIRRKKSFSKNSKTAEYLGCDWNVFKEHLESLFENWMNWENWGVYDPMGARTWNIDHIVPLAKFDLSKEEEIKKAFNYTNCRPYCSKANLVEQHYR